ncbi:tRNA-splicing endonuclease subunit sen54 N-term-domain-containing protein [Crepidotus variabilis]|uniref:tRNA-splicing endonuclease subunit sen54 N-term-domain-containing protein n=1 Tax=Crepidotus variabilis TaxID=179855 RepID=A0A9P6JM84_9AGAR|nr:tRNA-splicing endonuclease subunit sen54 N-term-domain-containing protein [Crepidotus variabilis]
MDDSLEVPITEHRDASLLDNSVNDEDQASDDEEGVLDWTKLLPASARPVIPKRGEKEYEPRAAGGTSLQMHILDRSRNAMFDTLRTTRSTSSKAISYGIWHPTLARTEVTVARGIHFTTMGHSAPRTSIEEGATKSQKRLELLPEEAVYLIERGTLFCWKELALDPSKRPGLTELAGSPMSVQQAYTEMLGTEDMSLEKFQVFSYLKRLGYVVTRAIPPNNFYPTPPPQLVLERTESTLKKFATQFFKFFANISRPPFANLDWWNPVWISAWPHCNKNYASIFRSLRIIPAGHSISLQPPQTTRNWKDSTPYRIFYNLYKPATPFKKSAPQHPDFQLVVVNARTTPIPTLEELTNLFNTLPETPLPGPRKKHSQSLPPLAQAQPNPSQIPVNQQTTSNLTSSLSEITNTSNRLFTKLFPWLFRSSTLPITPTTIKNVQKPNPFVALKTGKKIIIVAAVDMGNISFFRFGQGEFTEWPMM